MPKFLLRIQYTAEGIEGVLRDGGTARVEAAQKAAASLGGSFEAFYFAFGDDDAIVIADFPDDASAAALSMTVGASHKVRVSATRLIDPEEIDAAAKMRPDYRPPGG